MLLVSEIMTRSIVTLAKKTTLDEAAMTLANMGVSGAPVCDENGRVLGVFSKSDVVMKVSGGSAQGTLYVGDMMSSKVFSVRPSDPLKTAVWLMVSESVHRLMVVEDENKLVGILTPMDVLKAIVSGKLSVASLDG